MVTERRMAALIPAARMAVPDDLPELIWEHARLLGASEACLYLADYDQRVLCPLSGREARGRADLAIDATVAGRCYRRLEVEEVDIAEVGRRVWVPVLDGSERLGVLEIVLPPDAGENRND